MQALDFGTRCPLILYQTLPDEEKTHPDIHFESPLAVRAPPGAGQLGPARDGRDDVIFRPSWGALQGEVFGEYSPIRFGR